MVMSDKPEPESKESSSGERSSPVDVAEEMDGISSTKPPNNVLLLRLVGRV